MKTPSFIIELRCTPVYAACVLLVAFSLATPSHSQFQYSEPQSVFKAIYGHNAAACGDFDGDGDEDIVTTAAGVQLIRNIGNGTFIVSSPIQTVNTTTYRSIEAIDFDLDGDMDILVASQETNEVGWFENAGDASFSSLTVISSDLDSPTRAYAADFDNDGDLDLVTSSHNDDRVTYYERLSGNSFDDPILVAGNADGAECIFTADLDGDGFQDILVAARWSNRIAWFRNESGNGFSGTNLISTTAEGARWVDAADMDGDGDIDVLSASAVDDTLQWFANDGAGNFSAGNVITTACDGARVVVAQDFDGDGDIDVAGISENDTKLRLFSNDGGGMFTPEWTRTIEGGRHVTTGDVNGDGLPDLLCSSGDLLAYTLTNLGFNTFADPHFVTGSPDTIFKLAIGDVNNDGLKDIYYGTAWSDELGLILQHLNREYETPRLAPWSLNNPRPQAVVDMDGDGQADLLATASLNHLVFWGEMNASSDFQEQHVVGNGFYQAGDATYLDIENDGDIDVIAIGISGDGLTLFENNGDGSFTEFTDFLSENTNHEGMTPIDMNGDGLTDLVTFKRSQGEVSVFINLGGSFEEHTAVDTATLIDAEVADMNNDGHLDVVVTTNAAWDEPATDRIQLWLSDGQGNFFNGLPLPGVDDSGPWYALELGDLDADGLVDIVLDPLNAGGRYWMKNTGGGTFLAEEYIAHGAGGEEFFLEDMDGDGDLDILSYDDNGIWFFEYILIAGCIDPEACNFSPTAAEDDGSCCFDFCGCTDLEASNYDATAVCDNGTCSYFISGHVFDDFNEDGVWDDNEYALPFRWVYIPSAGISMITNDEGYFESTIPAGSYSVYLAPDSGLPYNTTPNPLATWVDANNGQGLEFGISKEAPDFAICVDLYPTGGTFLCNDDFNFNICFRNMGNLPIDGIVTLTFDDLYQDYTAVTPIDSVVGNTIYMSFTDLNPGQMFMYDVLLLTPTVDDIGEFVTVSTTVTGFYEGEQVAYGEQTYTQEVTCA